MTDAEVEAEILALALERAPKSLCPSEVARKLDDDWRPLMPRVREIAFALQRVGRLRITQKGKPVDPNQVKGPIRLQLPG